MKKIISTLFFTIFFLASNAQNINDKINEVYGSNAQQLVFNDPNRLNFLTNLLEKRVKIQESKYLSDDKYPKLSSVPLLNRYNPALERDLQFNPDNFNPLKYAFNFYSAKETVVYRVDNTDYVIVIYPQTSK